MLTRAYEALKAHKIFFKHAAITIVAFFIIKNVFLFGAEIVDSLRGYSYEYYFYACPSDKETCVKVRGDVEVECYMEEYSETCDSPAVNKIYLSPKRTIDFEYCNYDKEEDLFSCYEYGKQYSYWALDLVSREKVKK